MTNEEKYKTVGERIAAFFEFCNKQQCTECRFKNREYSAMACPFLWLADEYKKTKQDLPFITEGDNVLSVCDKELMVAFFGRKCAKEVCDTLNAAALAWHKRMNEKEGSNG